MTERNLTILLLRHGQTDSNANGVIQGHLPTPLNELGRRQAELLARRAAGVSPPVEVVVSSDLARAVETAGPVAGACGVPLMLDKAWRERFLGSFQGKTVGERGIWLAATGHSDVHDAEPVEEMLARVRRALVGLPGQFPSARVVAVMTHGGPVRMVQRLFAERRIPVPAEHPILEGDNSPNCSITRVLFDRTTGLWSLDCLHDVAHLAELATATDAG